MILLEVRGLTKSFGGVQAVRGVSLDVAAGETVAVIGPNGAGKTTCFDMIGGQRVPDLGTIRFAGRDTAGLPPHALWRLGLGRTFQVAAGFASLTVRENVQVALISHRRCTGGLGRPAARVFVAEADALLARVGLGGLADRLCGALAYGHLRRLELALALANAPRLLLMDEPTAGVAAGDRIALMDLVVAIGREQDIAILFTEHHMDVVFGHAERVVVLHRGQVVADGRPEVVRADPRVREIYLGTTGEEVEGRC